MHDCLSSLQVFSDNANMYALNGLCKATFTLSTEWLEIKLKTERRNLFIYHKLQLPKNITLLLVIPTEMVG